MTHEPAKHALDQADPHHELPHEHVIVRASTLVGVLATLLILTVITVAQAQSEAFLNAAFGVELPQIFNVVVVMSIAVIKASIVALFFMQLKYDNPLNAIVFLFCLFAVGLFLGFTMIDLGNRGIVNPAKSDEIQAGGLGLQVPGRKETGGLSLVDFARMQRIDHITNLYATGQIDLRGMTPVEYYETVDKPRFVHKPHKAHEPAVSTSNVSIPPKPVGPALFEAHAQPADHAPAH